MIRHLKDVRSSRDLHSLLEWHGWSTTSPHEWDTWHAYGWPELEDGEVTQDDLDLASALQSRGWLGEWETDDEGAPCFRILESAVAS